MTADGTNDRGRDCEYRITGNRARDVSGYKTRGPRLPGLEDSLSSQHRPRLDLIVSAGKDRSLLQPSLPWTAMSASLKR